jgi:hypothetical protein
LVCARRSSAAHFVEQTVKKLLIAALVAFALPAFARPPMEKAVHHEKSAATERANERQKEADAKVIQAKFIEKTKINEH